MDFLDTYSIKARLFPAVLVIAPLIILILLSASWVDPGLPELVSSVAVAVLFFAASNLARRLGRAKERKLFAQTGGHPLNRELHYTNRTLPEGTKARYRAFLAERLGVAAPNPEDEINDPRAADAFYEQAYTWLRENTRDTDTFKILFNENIHYGYYRNLLGLKPLGIALNLITLAAAWAIVRYQPEFASLTHGKLIALGGLAAIHFLYFMFGVTKKAVLDASAIYARQLILSTEVLIAKATPV